MDLCTQVSSTVWYGWLIVVHTDKSLALSPDDMMKYAQGNMNHKMITKYDYEHKDMFNMNVFDYEI